MWRRYSAAYDVAGNVATLPAILGATASLMTGGFMAVPGVLYVL